MRLVVQIPCLNEEQTLPATIADIPREIDGVDQVEILVIDDGSTDRTAEVARKIGVDHIIRHTHRCGLARAFRTGMDASLRLGADIIVNTDGDNQYAGSDIPKLIRPILEGRADMVVGDRRTSNVPHFSWSKKALERLGSSVVRLASGISVPDAVSGFRAFSRESALRLNVLSSFSYTIETLVQAGAKGFSVASVAVTTNPKTRDSRLFASIPQFVGRSLATLMRTYTMYSPLRVFLAIGTVFLLIGATPIVRFLCLYAVGNGSGHVQSLILGGVAIVVGFMLWMIGLIADLIALNRQLIEIVLEKVRRLELRQAHHRTALPEMRNGLISVEAEGHEEA